MNIHTKRIKSILKDLTNIKHTKPERKDFCIIQLTFDVQNFYLKCKTIGEFLKKLRNNKNSLFPNLPNNRDFFSRIGKNGLHNEIIYTDKIELNIFLIVQ
jgi:hypothetical protein